MKKDELRGLEEKISMQLMALKSSLASTEDEIKITNQEEKAVLDSMNLIESNIMKFHTETKKLF